MDPLIFVTVSLSAIAVSCALAFAIIQIVDRLFIGWTMAVKWLTTRTSEQVGAQRIKPAQDQRSTWEMII